MKGLLLLLLLNLSEFVASHFEEGKDVSGA